MLNTLSHRNKLLLMIMPTLIIGLLSLSAGAYWFINTIIETELQTSMLAMTGKTAEGINIWCKTLIFEPETIAATPAAKAINTDFNKIDLQNINRHEILHNKYPDVFLDIYAANKNGVYHTVNKQGGNYSFFEGDISTRQYFQDIMSGGPAQITLPLVSRTTGIPTMFVVAPITDDEGTPQGLIGAGISLSYVQKLAESLKVGETGYGIVIAQDGTFLYHPNKDFMMGKKMTELSDPTVAQLGNLMLSGGSGIFHYELEGQSRIAFYQPIPFTGWSIATTISEKELLAPVIQMIQSLAIITFITLLLIVITIWFVTKRLSYPLLKLTHHAQEITAGNFQIEPFIVTSQDEIGILTNSFNIMTATLRTMMKELELKNVSLNIEVLERMKTAEALQHAHDQLGDKVTGKTEELAVANEDLTAMNEEIRAMNETLEETNQRLQAEIQVRHLTEDDLLTRERQYRATTSLLTGPIDEVAHCLESILQNALQLIKAPDGFIGLYDDTGTFLIHYGIGIHESRVMESMANTVGLQGQVYATGDVLYVADYNSDSRRIQDERLKCVSSCIVLPLKQGGYVKGILAASWVDQMHPISEDDVKILQQFGDLASVALERSNNHEKSLYLAFHDELTGLANRASLNRYLEEEIHKAGSGQSGGVILFIDMDDLKSVNDNFGHSSGDLIIMAASKHIREAVGEKAFIARLGGDEFIAIIPDKNSLQNAPEIANKTIAALRQEYDVADQKLNMTASIGVVLYPDDGDIAEDLLMKADSAMYDAKKSGRNCWRFYEPILLQEAYDKIMLTNALHHVLERNEVFLHYQPQITLDGRRVSGFEALLRWNSPDYGLVPPMRFIPLAEQSGLIIPIGKWVMEQACEFARHLSNTGRSDVHVAVNISPKQLHADDFVTSVCEIITNAGITPQQITIEVTESVLIESMAESIAKLSQLREFGVSLALDDFGTGYSSLTYLNSLPVNILKIDKSFIDNITSNETRLQVVGSIINLGHALGLTIVAEGVETDPQLELLKKYGCDHIQGYIFSRPISREDAITFLP